MINIDDNRQANLTLTVESTDKNIYPNTFIVFVKFFFSFCQFDADLRQQLDEHKREETTPQRDELFIDVNQEFMLSTNLLLEQNTLTLTHKLLVV
ncbi:CLUMA_CG001317, isoform A [Clunio marinus]|uniref:CLUMA_CG001317, isoform A n=1 Tax=Clunio marinus TaxID=568069 RepID=A0A1J1HJD1_9DIPT|nr:CLUMA_CG001317, isoform A [Clunio marinus]